MTRLRNERGWAVITAVLVIALISSAGLATYAFVDTQARNSGKERTRESSFYLSDAALNEQAFLLSRNWPTAAGQYPPQCTPSTGGLSCPSATGAWKASFDTGDYAGSTWKTAVYDDDAAAPNFFSDATASVNHYDANGNGVMWVRAESTVQGKTRIVVAQVKQNWIDLSPQFPKNVITAGSFSTSNDGNKVIVDAKGNASQASSVAVRCNDANDKSCVDIRDGQIAPATSVATGYGGGNALSDQAIRSLASAARANKTYYTSCPPSLAGAVVYIVNADCDYVANTVYNSPEKPGIVIVQNGYLYIGGTSDFYGVIYMLNKSGSSGIVFETHGDAAVYGSVAVDGPGKVDSGSSKVNINYDPNSFNALIGAGQVGIVQNSWRELLKK